MASKSAPEPAAPIDIGATVAAAGQQATKLTDKQFQQLIKYYPDMERQALGSVGNIVTMVGGGGDLFAWTKYEPTKKEIKEAKKAGEPRPEAGWVKQKIGEVPENTYTKEAKDAIDAAMAQSANVSAMARQSAALGSWGTGKANEIYAQAGPTEIERRLEQQALEDLSLGRALSAEELRNAAQSVRSAFAARGLGSSLGSAAAEMLNRDAFANQRLMQRRGFAGTVNDMLTNNLLRRRGQAGEFAALGSNAIGQASQAYGLASNIGMQGAANLAALDPTRFAIQPGLQMAGGIQGNSMNMIGNTFGNTMQLAGNVAAFNASMLDARRNSYLNNQAALEAARITGGAANQAGWMNMIGGLGMGVGSALSGTNFSDKRMKKDIKQTGKDGVLGLKTYEYRFKGESKDAPKRTGFMAQEVAEVMPEAVEEVDYKGKKRLAIKPQVIGMALAQALAAEQDAMFEQGYTVGKGFGR